MLFSCNKQLATMADFIFAPPQIPLNARSFNSRVPLRERGYEFEGCFVTINDHYPNQIPKRSLQIWYSDPLTKTFIVSPAGVRDSAPPATRPWSYPYDYVFPLNAPVVPRLVSNAPYPEYFGDPFPIEEICKWGGFFTNDERCRYYALSHIIPSAKDTFIPVFKDITSYGALEPSESVIFLQAVRKPQPIPLSQSMALASDGEKWCPHAFDVEKWYPPPPTIPWWKRPISKPVEIIGGAEYYKRPKFMHQGSPALLKDCSSKTIIKEIDSDDDHPVKKFLSQMT